MCNTAKNILEYSEKILPKYLNYDYINPGGENG
jgi:hypothetical protein